MMPSGATGSLIQKIQKFDPSHKSSLKLLMFSQKFRRVSWEFRLNWGPSVAKQGDPSDYKIWNTGAATSAPEDAHEVPEKTITSQPGTGVFLVRGASAGGLDPGKVFFIRGDREGVHILCIVYFRLFHIVTFILSFVLITHYNDAYYVSR